MRANNIEAICAALEVLAKALKEWGDTGLWSRK